MSAAVAIRELAENSAQINNNGSTPALLQRRAELMDIISGKLKTVTPDAKELIAIQIAQDAVAAKNVEIEELRKKMEVELGEADEGEEGEGEGEDDDNEEEAVKEQRDVWHTGRFGNPLRTFDSKLMKQEQEFYLNEYRRRQAWSSKELFMKSFA
jgi:FtsZ-binding cell division protein ZapB